jgi:hypothetical protein
MGNLRLAGNDLKDGFALFVLDCHFDFAQGELSPF